MNSDKGYNLFLMFAGVSIGLIVMCGMVSIFLILLQAILGG